MDAKANMRNKNSKKNCQTGKVDAPFASNLEDATEVERLLAEPKTDYVSVGGFLCQDEERKCLGTDYFSGTFEQSMRTAIGGLNSKSMQVVDDGLNIGVLDGFLDGVEEVDDFHAADALSTPCEDYLLDVDFPEKVVDWDHHAKGDGFCIGNSSSEIHSPGSTISVGAAEPLKSPTLSIPEAERQSIHEMTVTNETRESIRGNVGYLTPVEDKTETPESQVLDDMENDSDPSASGVSLTGEGSAAATNLSSVLKLQRTRKRPKRYIEESSELSNKSSKGRKNSTSTLKNKCLRTGSHGDSDSASGGMDPLCGSGNQMASGNRSCRGHPKKKEVMLSESESSDSEFEAEFVPTKVPEKEDRRKFQIMWSIAEVTKLVDGIAQYGVGRWTDIKKQLFPLSRYRTPIDLRDKWRNLLRASGVYSGKRKVGDGARLGRDLPSSLKSRIAELAKLHPYPRNSKAKFVPSGRISVPIRRDAGKGSSSDFEAAK